MDGSHLNGTAIPKSILLTLTALRKRYEVNVADERMILDGALKDTRVLIVLDAACARTEALEAIADWVREGGVLLSNSRTRSLEMEPVAAFDAAFGITPDSEEAWGHVTYRVVPADWAPHMSTVPELHSAVGWKDLAQGVRPLFECPDQPTTENVHISRCFAAFENRCGKGRGVFFSAPLDLDAPADALFTPNPAFALLLEDCCRAFGGVEPMTLQEGEIVRTHIDGKILVLREDHTIAWA